jgi:Ca-activated chloride channel homolog
MRRSPPFVLALLLSLLLAVALFVALLRPGQAPPSATDQVRVTQVDTSAYPQVSIYTAVGDSAAGRRADFTRADFQIVEDGAPVDLTGFVGPGGSSISTALVIDRSGSMDEAGKIEGARKAATAFVQLLRPGDHAALISFNGQVRTVEPFTGDQADLRSAIERLRADGGTALYDGIVQGVDLLRNQPGRRVLLVLTDGQDCRDLDSCPDDAGSSHSLSEAISYATAVGQPVYVVGLGRRGGNDYNGIDEGVLQRIATGTDGAYYYSPAAADLAGLYTTLAGNLQGEYRLTYVSPRPFYDGTRRDIQVTVAGLSTGAGYTERHLINVTSNPLVGAALLLPLLGLLGLPGLLAARRGRDLPARAPSSPLQLTAAAPTVVAPDLAPVASNVYQAEENGTSGYAPAPAAAGQRCVNCAAPLRPGAKFCSSCGSTQPEPAPEGRRTFCDMCGRPLSPGATFCEECGEQVSRRE